MKGNLQNESTYLWKKIILGIVIFSLVIVSIETYLVGWNKESFDYIVKVNGWKITKLELQDAINEELRRQKKSFGKTLSDQLMQQSDYVKQLEQRVLLELINRVLIFQYIEKLKIEVSDFELKKKILKNPFFKTDGKFDNLKYRTVIANSGFTPDQYAESLRKELKVKRFIQGIFNTDFILKSEFLEMKNIKFQKRQIRQGIIKVNSFIKKQHIYNFEVKRYFDEHYNDFVRSERFRVSYIKLQPDRFLKKIIKTDIQDWYKHHKSFYFKPRMYHYRIIQTNSISDANSILVQLKKGANFASLAKKKSLDIISAPKGGEVGWFSLNDIPSEFKKSHLTKRGEISKIIKSSLGYLIVYLDDIQSERNKKLSEVYPFVIEQLKKNRKNQAFHILKKKVNEALNEDNESLSAVERVSGLKAIKTNWFTKKTIPKELDFDLIKKFIFKENLIGKKDLINNNSEIIRVDDDSFFVLRINEYIPEILKSFNEVKHEILVLMKRKKAELEAKKFANKILVDFRTGKKNVFDSVGLVLETKKIENSDLEDPIVKTAFDLSFSDSKKRSCDVVRNLHGDFVFVVLDKVIPEKPLQRDIKKLIEELQVNNSKLLFESLLQSLRKKGTIEYLK